jgi:hypothetical protein
MAILNNSNAISPSGYDVNNSLRFRRSASAYLSRTPASAGNRKMWTWSAWVKRGLMPEDTSQYTMLSSGGSGGDSIMFSDTNKFTVNIGLLGINAGVIPTQVLRDPAAWYHLVVTIDTAQATASNRVKMYINGNQITSFSTTNYPSQNADTTINSTTVQDIGRQTSYGNYFDGYLADVNFIDGQALTPSSFGETDTTTGSWKPKAYTSTYGTNGFYLKFSDIATTSGSNAGLGKDFSGNANYFTTNNISVTAGTTYDAMTDVPTLTSATVANYCVLNPLQKSSNVTLSNANLTWSTSGASTKVLSTIGMSSGKYYCEFTMASGNGNYGIATAQTGISGTNYLGNDANSWCYAIDGNKYTNGSGAAYGATYTSGDIIGVAFDADAGTLTYYKNGSSQGTAFTGLTNGPYFFAQGADPSAGSVNFGQRPFSYTPPTGFVRLNTYNLPDSTIKKGNTVMDATTYTGNSATPRSITNTAEFKPDLVWIKNRSNAYSHNIYDSVRGSGSAYSLQSDNTNSESTNASNTALYGYLSAFNSNGFSTTNGSDPTSPSIWANQSGQTYVGWQWQAGQGSTSSNTNGTRTSTVSVNATAGFSIVTYTGNGTTGATIGHGLGVAPKMMIVKLRSGDNSWAVYHSSIGTNYMLLNSTLVSTAASAIWNAAPTSSVFTVGNDLIVNTNGGTYVGYCWSEIAGFSKFGSYTGNGSADGPFIYTGFRPKFVLVKSSSLAGQNWNIFDTSRDTYNVEGQYLAANTSNAEGTLATLDGLSNGFKIRTSGNYANANGETYIYMAFAENPFKNSLAR